MPTYSYACTECGHRFDAVQAFTDNTLEVCPRCSGRLRKLFGSVGVVFKGSGFYRTDSRQDGKKSKTSVNGSSTSDAASSSGSGDGGSSSGSGEKNGSSAKNGSGEKSGSSPAPSTAAAST